MHTFPSSSFWYDWNIDQFLVWPKQLAVSGLTETISTFILGVDCISTPLTAGAIPCSDGAVARLNSGDPCDREYQRCEDGSWRRSKCVGGVPNNATRECVPYTAECPDPGRLF